MRLDPSNPSVENAGSNASTSIRRQMCEGTNNERVPLRSLFIVFTTRSPQSCICCASPPTFFAQKDRVTFKFVFVLMVLFSILCLQLNFFSQLLLSMCCLQLSEKLFVCVFVFSVCVSVFATLVYLQQLYLVMTRVLCRLSPLIVALPPDSTADAVCCRDKSEEGR